MAKKNPGQKILAECPFCHEGKLLVRIEHKEFHDGAIGARGTPDSDTVHELVCSNCCLKFAAADEGKSIWTFTEEKLLDIAIPDGVKAKKPDVCPSCGNDTFKQGMTSLPSDDEDWGPVGGFSRHEHKRTLYLYCNDCLSVVHILRNGT